MIPNGELPTQLSILIYKRIEGNIERNSEYVSSDGITAKYKKLR